MRVMSKTTRETNTEAKSTASSCFDRALFDFFFCLSTSIPVLTTGTYVVAWRGPMAQGKSSRSPLAFASVLYPGRCLASQDTCDGPSSRALGQTQDTYDAPPAEPSGKHTPALPAELSSKFRVLTLPRGSRPALGIQASLL